MEGSVRQQVRMCSPHVLLSLPYFQSKNDSNYRKMSLVDSKELWSLISSVNGNYHDRIIYIKETKMELEGHKVVLCLLHQWTFEPAERPPPELYFLLTIATRPSALFVLKGVSLVHQPVFFFCRGPKWSLNSWTFMLVVEAYSEMCWPQSLTTHTWPSFLKKPSHHVTQATGEVSFVMNLWVLPL